MAKASLLSALSVLSLNVSSVIGLEKLPREKSSFSLSVTDLEIPKLPNVNCDVPSVN